ncbi:uncharacterized protein LOC130021786 [Sorex fumeus]|uniref:uncharacterized protein LOC130021786 n=1 Tax=Sorex fumeus TaxID=62283 RepID=UPI0024AD5799|nr:uncharacterized protein LOC130021786 [Sorex fumeus]
MTSNFISCFLSVLSRIPRRQFPLPPRRGSGATWPSLASPPRQPFFPASSFSPLLAAREKHSAWHGPRQMPARLPSPPRPLVAKPSPAKGRRLLPRRALAHAAEAGALPGNPVGSSAPAARPASRQYPRQHLTSISARIPASIPARIPASIPAWACSSPGPVRAQPRPPAGTRILGLVLAPHSAPPPLLGTEVSNTSTTSPTFPGVNAITEGNLFGNVSISFPRPGTTERPEPPGGEEQSPAPRRHPPPHQHPTPSVQMLTDLHHEMGAGVTGGRMRGGPLV